MLHGDLYRCLGQNEGLILCDQNLAKSRATIFRRMFILMECVKRLPTPQLSKYRSVFYGCAKTKSLDLEPKFPDLP